MTNNNSIVDILKERALPAHIQNDHPVFVSFIDAFLEYLEQEKNPHDVAINLNNYRNIDETLDEFVDYFSKEFLINIPKDILADKQLLVKHIKKFYLNKGNEASYRFLFRVLYNEDVEFYYPKVDVLRASDGKWYEQRSIKITLTNQSDILKFQSSDYIIGQTSAAEATIESSLNYNERGENIVEVSLSNIKGTFQHGENVLINYIDANGEEQTITETIVEIYNGVQISTAGSGYSIGDLFIVRNSDDEEIAKGEVKQVTKGPVQSLVIDTAGTGYNGSVQEVTVFYALPGNEEINGDDLLTTPLDGSDSNSSGTNYLNYTFDQVITLVEVEGTPDDIVITDSSSSFGTGAFGYVSVVGNDGQITEVTLVEGGDNYDSPTAEVISSTGSGAEISVVGGGGAVADTVLLGFPVILDTDYDSSGDYTVYPDFTGSGDANATGTMTGGTLAEYPGRYLNEDGHLSSNKKLQDNFFYQDYSYVVKAGLAIDSWRDLVKKVLHPAGLALFGEIEVISNIDTSISFSENLLIQETEAGTQTATMTEAVIKLYVDDSSGEAVDPVLDSNGNHLIDWQKDSSGEYVQT